MTPLEIFLFLRPSFKKILLFTLFGLIISFIFFSQTPKQYLAVGHIAMAKISNNGQLGVMVEEPAQLIFRLSSPTSFNPKVVKDCAFEDDVDATAILARSIRVNPVRSVPNVVELKVFGSSPKVALACANSVFELIKLTQTQISIASIEGAKLELVQQELRLQKSRELLAKTENLQQSMGGVAYLSTRDEMLFLLDRINSLKRDINNNENLSARLLSPIYTSDAPISPNLIRFSTAGLILGLLFGIFLSLIQKRFQEIKAS